MIRWTRTAVATAALIGAGCAGTVAWRATPAGATTTNLLVNGGFEARTLKGWTCDPGTALVVTSPTYAGRHALAATPTSSDDAQCTQLVPVKPSSSYTLSGWFEGDYAFLGDSGTGTTDTDAWTASAPQWTRLKATFSTGPTTTSVTVYLHGWYAEGTIYADSLVLKGAPGTTTTTRPSTTTTTTRPSTTSTTTSTTVPSGGGGLPAHVLEGYWQDFTNGATPLTLASVPTSYNLVAVAFASATGTPGQVAFSLDPTLASDLGGYTTQDFVNDIKTLHARGQKVVLSVGGQNGSIAVDSSAAAGEFAASVYSLMQQYGFDGVDIDLENGVNPTYLSSGLEQLSADAGSSLIITMAPQTLDVQSTTSDYFALALRIKNILTIMNTQYYNSGTMDGCDGSVYAESTENFLTALACIQLQGGLSPSQIGLGLPASTSAAGSGYVSPATLDDALECLAGGASCGSFVPPAKWPAIRGAMDWSINWDASNAYYFANTVAPVLSGLG